MTDKNNDMTCEQAQPLLAALVEDMLDADEKAAVERHLDSCENCRAEKQSLAGILGAIAGARLDGEPSDLALQRLRREARKSVAGAASVGSRPWFGAPALRTAAAVLLAVAVITVAFRLAKIDDGKPKQQKVMVSPAVLADREGISLESVKDKNRDLLGKIKTFEVSQDKEFMPPEYRRPHDDLSREIKRIRKRVQSELAVVPPYLSPPSRGWTGLDRDIAAIDHELGRLSRRLEKL